MSGPNRRSLHGQARLGDGTSQSEISNSQTTVLVAEQIALDVRHEVVGVSVLELRAASSPTNSA